MHPLFIALRRLPTRLSRGCSWLLAATVLMVAVFAASPNVHQWLHADADHTDHECAITLYAQGVTPAAAGVVLLVVAWRLLGISRKLEAELFLPAPRYLHLPGRAPPRV